MYYDDTFDPTNENDFDVPHFDETISVTNSVSTLNSNAKKYLKQMELLKMQDKDYRKIYRVLNGKKIAIELYSTNSNPGSTIRDATSGSRISNMRVGCRDEDLFFKVAFSSCEKGISNTDSNLFFFDSPDHYERFTGSSVSPQEKSQWEKKFMAEKMKRQ
jgi:hypothetical protein